MTLKRIRVLVVDDSAFARKVIREVLAKGMDIEIVGVARDGLEALEKISELKPDVVTLDLNMPELDGLGVLRSLPKDSLAKVVIVSVSEADSEMAIEALQMGAVELVTKPTALATDRLFEISSELLTKVRAAAIAVPRFERATRGASKPLIPLSSHTISTRLVVIGTSTGGPQALTHLFKNIPAGFSVPLAVALHIPAGYTASLAARISKESEVKLVEASDGMELLPGNAVICPGGMHLQIRCGHLGRMFANISREPLDLLYHPSVDRLFASAADAVGANTLGVVLTGMGSDGLLGAEAIRRAGGQVIAESASSCVVFGMPRTVIESGAANAEAPLEGIVDLIVKSIYRT